MIKAQIAKSTKSPKCGLNFAEELKKGIKLSDMFPERDDIIEFITEYMKSTPKKNWLEGCKINIQRNWEESTDMSMENI